ncbi:hypothetical protein BJY52DRAFT_1326507, partial [Lactarius psammicola]
MLSFIILIMLPTQADTLDQSSTTRSRTTLLSPHVTENVSYRPKSNSFLSRNVGMTPYAKGNRTGSGQNTLPICRQSPQERCAKCYTL